MPVCLIGVLFIGFLGPLCRLTVSFSSENLGQQRGYHRGMQTAAWVPCGDVGAVTVEWPALYVCMSTLVTKPWGDPLPSCLPLTEGQDSSHNRLFCLWLYCLAHLKVFVGTWREEMLHNFRVLTLSVTLRLPAAGGGNDASPLHFPWATV